MATMAATQASLTICLRTIAIAILVAVNLVMALPSSSADFYLPSIPDITPGTPIPLMHAGIMDVDAEVGTGLFFWSVKSMYQLTSRPKTIIWLNGGPGCSSMDGALLEMGPFRFSSKTQKLVQNEGAWTDYINMIFVDQPIGVGFSRPDSNTFAQDIVEASDQFVTFLRNYIAVFPELAFSDIYLGGESYAGQYVPYIWKALEQASDPPIRIEGLILGNPWLDPAHQYPSYAIFAEKHQLIPQDKFKGLEELQQQCLASLSESSILPAKDDICDSLFSYVVTNSDRENKNQCFNVYKYPLKSTQPECGLEWPAEVPLLKSYLSRPDVQRAFHVPDLHNKWEECSNIVSSHFHETSVPASKTLIPGALAKLPILVAIGDLDFICNGYGLEKTFENMKWNDHIGYSDLVTAQDLVFGEKSIGSVRTDRNLTVAHITNGTHMLPVDQQYESRMLVHRFVGITDHYDPLIDHPLSGSNPVSQPKPGSGDNNPGSKNGDKTSPQTDDNSSTPNGASEDEINDAKRKAYAQAGVAALIVVAVFGLVLFIVWQRGNSGFSFGGFVKAVLHTGFPKRRKTADYIQLRSVRNRDVRPEIILEEDEEEAGVV